MDTILNTKERIFDTFIEMTSAIGYENVTTRDIAGKIGINPASIYYHFESKDKILEYAYEYYQTYMFENRMPLDEMKKFIETADAKEIIPNICYNFESTDQQKYVRMILITKIVFMRLFQDPLANAIFTLNNVNNAERVIDILKHGIEIGRIDPGFDIETFADLLIGAIAIMGIKAFASADYQVSQLEQEKRILELLTRLLSTALI